VGVVGLVERAPVWVATAHAGVGIAVVRIRFSDGTTDQMAPVYGWAALAHQAPTGTTDAAVTAVLQGLDGSGKVVTTVKLPYYGPNPYLNNGSLPGNCSKGPMPPAQPLPPPPTTETVPTTIAAPQGTTTNSTMAGIPIR
jgi:hypothetical protein